MTTEEVLKGQTSKGVKSLVVLNLIKGYGRCLDGNGGVWAVFDLADVENLTGCLVEHELRAGVKEGRSVKSMLQLFRQKIMASRGGRGSQGGVAAWGNILKIEPSEGANEFDVGIFQNGKIKKAL